MRTTSALYKTLRSESGSFYEVRVTVTSGGTYGHDTLKSVRISQSLASGNGLSVVTKITIWYNFSRRERSQTHLRNKCGRLLYVYKRLWIKYGQKSECAASFRASVSP